MVNILHKFNVITVIVAGSGALLIYSAIKGTDPREVIWQTLGTHQQTKANAQSSSAPTNKRTPRHGQILT